MSSKDSPADELAESLGRLLNEVQCSWSPAYPFGTATSVDINCNEVYPNVWLGDGDTARNLEFLKQIGVTHVLNAAMGKKFGMVDTDPSYYQKANIKFLGFQMMDLSTTNIAQYFDEAAEFIDNALQSNGKVFVHCLMGISRSSTCVIAFLMLKRNCNATEAITIVRQKRWVAPNFGFLRQIAVLDLKLRERQTSMLK